MASGGIITSAQQTVQSRTVRPAGVTGELLDIMNANDGKTDTRATSGKPDYVGMSVTMDAGGLQNIIGVKEASANVVQMCDIVANTPESFLLLSGDDPLIVAVMGIGGRGIICVTSNQVPAECAQIVELCERGDFAGARKLYNWLLPLIQVNFVESNPIPCKSAMAEASAWSGFLITNVISVSCQTRSRRPVAGDALSPPETIVFD